MYYGFYYLDHWVQLAAATATASSPSSIDVNDDDPISAPMALLMEIEID